MRAGDGRSLPRAQLVGLEPRSLGLWLSVGPSALTLGCMKLCKSGSGPGLEARDPKLAVALCKPCRSGCVFSPSWASMCLSVGEVAGWIPTVP